MLLQSLAAPTVANPPAKALSAPDACPAAQARPAAYWCGSTFGLGFQPSARPGGAAAPRAPPLL
eukprot:1801108-Alexandrium_andersonii.AAC.1